MCDKKALSIALLFLMQFRRDLWQNLLSSLACNVEIFGIILGINTVLLLFAVDRQFFS